MKNHRDDHDLGLELRIAHTEVAPSRKRLTRPALAEQNVRFGGTGGVSKNNRGAGFLPAYMDTVTGRVALSCFADGRPAPIHVLDGMPEEWVERRSPKGRVLSVACSVVTGFVRDGIFYTREAAEKESRH